MKLTIKLFLLLLLCMPAIVHAEFSAEVQADFAVVDGYVVMPINDEYIVDLDANDNLRVGDILTLVDHGKKILHPVTKEVVGTVFEPLGFLQVTRILSGYSYAKTLTPAVAPANGAPVKRFEQVPVSFVDSTAAGAAVGRQLQANLPQFKWLENGDSASALLVFSLQGDTVKVENPQGDLLHKYQVTEDQLLVSTAAVSPRPAMTTHNGPKPKPLQQFANAIVGAFGITNEERFAEMDAAIIRQKQAERKGIWMGPNLTGTPAGIAVADLDGDNLQETAIVLDHKIIIARIVDGEFNALAEVSIPMRLQALSIDAMDLDDNGRSELYLSALNGYQVASFVVERVGESYEIVIDNVRWFLRAVDLLGERGRVLVGQNKGGDNELFTGGLFQVGRAGGSLVEGNAVELPSQLNLFSFAPFQDDQGGLNYAHLTQGDYLKVVNPAGEGLWDSSDYFGGSENCFTHRAEYKDELLAPYCMLPRMIRTSGNEVLAAQNDGQRITQSYKKFKNSRVVSLAWNGYTFVEQWRTASQFGYLADFVLADADNDGLDELVMAVNLKHKGLTDDARSSVVVYELE